MKLTLIASGEDRQRLLGDGWDAIEQFALTGDYAYIEKIYEIDDRLAPRGTLKPVPNGGAQEASAPASPEVPRQTT